MFLGRFRCLVLWGTLMGFDGFADVNELVSDCVDVAGNVVQHRVWITANGSVITPDHVAGYDHESVVSALGGTLGTVCAHWIASQPKILDNKGLGGRDEIPPNFLSWTYTRVQQWTQSSMWTANTATVGKPEYRNVPPVEALRNAQTLVQANPAIYPFLAEKLFLLANPWDRDSGWRQTQPVTAQRVQEYLDVGVDPELVAEVAALAVSPKVVREVLAHFSVYSIPQQTLVLAATVLPLEMVPQLANISKKDAADLPLMLHTLRNATGEERSVRINEMFPSRG